MKSYFNHDELERRRSTADSRYLIINRRVSAGAFVEIPQTFPLEISPVGYPVLSSTFSARILPATITVIVVVGVIANGVPVYSPGDDAYYSGNSAAATSGFAVFYLLLLARIHAQCEGRDETRRRNRYTGTYNNA